MKPTTTLLTGILLVVAGCAGHAERGASDSTSSGEGSLGTKSHSSTQPPLRIETEDRTFLREALQFGQMSARLGQLAQDNTQTGPIQDFGQQLVTDLNNFNQELAELASRKGSPATEQLTSSQQNTIQRLGALQGSAFDTAWSHETVQTLVKTVRGLKLAQTRSHDADILAFADKYLPEAQAHLNDARQLSAAGSALSKP